MFPSELDISLVKGSMPSQKGKEPTSGGPIFVGSGKQEEIVSELVIPLLVRFLAEEPSLEAGSLKEVFSSWIEGLCSGRIDVFGTSRCSESPDHPAQLFRRVVDYAAKELPRHDPNGLSETLPILSIKDNALDEAQLSRLEKEIGIPKTDPSQFLVTMRAIRTMAICLADYKMHPLELIRKAHLREKQAVLQLVKIDKLFLWDSCTHDVTHNAALENDRRFLDQLARALLYKPTVKKNVSPRLVLFALLALGFRLPNLTILQLQIDSDGKYFKSTEAFEKFVERSKKTFKAICSRMTQQSNNMEGTRA